MLSRTMVVGALALAVAGAVPAGALAKGGTGGGGGGGNGGGGGGGGKTTPVLPAPAIAPGTFDGIGPGPVYIHDSFGWAQTTRVGRDGSIVSVLDTPGINGIRAEFPNNVTETWLEPATRGAPSWKLVSASTDPLESSSPLQQTPQGPVNGMLALVGAEPGAVDTRADALLPFTAPTDKASTVSTDIPSFIGKTAIGFSSSSAATGNFESDGQAWLELDSTGRAPIGGNTGVIRWTFHTDGLSGATLTGTIGLSASGFDQVAVSEDPVEHMAAAVVDGQVVASVTVADSSTRYVGVEGSLNAAVDNFTVRAGGVDGS